MATESKNEATAEQPENELEGGSYEVIKKRLTESGKALATKADVLNEKRKETFGGTELQVIGNERVRTENNCVPRDIVNVGGTMLFAYNVYIGLRTETHVQDVFSLRKFEQTEGGFDLSQMPDEHVPGLFDNEQFQRDFADLYKYYKDAKLLQVRIVEGKLLAVFQIGNTIEDIKAFRWLVDPEGNVEYIDNRGEKDHTFPASHDFEWTETTREQHVSGRHPHINIDDEVFVETVGGDLTVKVEDNTEDGLGIYREDVDDPRQALDDADILYARVGSLILMKILPYQETTWRYLIFNTKNKHVVRIDAIGQACVQLPEDHGVIFPGGFYLQSGDTKVFDADTSDLRFKRAIRSPNGEDVLYIFYHKVDGRYLLLPYNLIRKEVQNPIQCHGFTLFGDGKMLVFRSASEEPTRVHPIQVWLTPFVSDEHAAEAPTDGSYLTKVGNADLVRGISDAYSLRRLIDQETPNRQTFEDLIESCNKSVDSYYWLGHDEVGNLKEQVDEIRKNAELIIDEYEKVQTLKTRALEAIKEAKEKQKDILRELRPEDWRKVSDFLHAMTALRKQRGHLITLKDVRYIDAEALQKLEDEVIEQFDRVSKHCVDFLLTGEALDPLIGQIDELMEKIEQTDKANELQPLHEELEGLNEGLNLLSEVVAGLQIEDPTQRTQILESISEVFGHLNRVRATMQSRRKELLSSEGKAEFAAQFKLLGQAVSSAAAMADTPEKCDEQLSRLMVQLEELEGRFSEFDEFLADLATKRQEIYDALGAKKQQLLDERQRRANNLATAADRIIEGINRRVKSFKQDDELNAYFASDAMVMKLRQLIEQLHELGDSVKADDVDSRLKSAQRDAIRNMRDKQDLYEDGDSIIKLGQHKFNVNTQAFELTMVPRGEGMALHLTGTDFYEPIDDEAFNATKEYWNQQIISENKEVYRCEYLAASMLFDAERGEKGLSIDRLTEAAHGSDAALVEVVRGYAADRYDEGYERGLHDADTGKILEKLLSVRATAGLLRFAPSPRAYACLYWSFSQEQEERELLQRRAISLGRLRKSFAHSKAEQRLAQDMGHAVQRFLEAHQLDFLPSEPIIAGRYLLEELTQPRPRFTTSQEAIRLRDALLNYLDLEGERAGFNEDLRALQDSLGEQVKVAIAWLEAFLDDVQDPTVADLRASLTEAAVVIVTEGKLDREESAAVTQLEVQGLLGNHPRVQSRGLKLRLDEFLARLTHFVNTVVPGYRNFKEVRQSVLERERDRLRLDEFKPRVLTSFVRNRLINDVYLHLIGDNLAKQLGAAGEKKRTDLMGMLLLISPPGYGKTTLMEYMASRLGMVFMKVNGPSLGHEVISLDPQEAPNATSRQEVNKINLAFEMANNVMLYLDDIQHTNPELLQKFISLCDGSRRVEGVWKGKTRTYDLRGKKFAVVMAGNPYTESGEKFQIPDMLSNRADTYNLGDILDGREEVFALSYIENALTSNGALAPVAARSLDDMHRFIKMAKGEEVPQAEFANSYSQVEIEEVQNILKRLFKAQDTVLRVNQEYIASASMDDRFRTEPSFKLQGSYRNMNKLAEKIVSAMNDAELNALVKDHYVGEGQTLTTGAEFNLLKLGELRDDLNEEEQARLHQIRKDFRRLQVQGGGDDDPVSRVTSTLGALGEHLDGIKERLMEAVQNADQRAQLQAKAANDREAWLVPHIEKLDQAVNALTAPKLNVRLENQTPKELQQALAEQSAQVERTLMPLVRSSTQNLEEMRSIARPLLELIELLKLNALSGEGTPRTRASKSAPKTNPAPKPSPGSKASAAPAPKTSAPRATASPAQRAAQNLAGTRPAGAPSPRVPQGATQPATPPAGARTPTPRKPPKG